ncbi:MAG: FtsX-like permease family protein [Anaerolineae bacterium]|nr:FtsX-like permease family protein [Anaerolineae bacterium]
MRTSTTNYSLGFSPKPLILIGWRYLLRRPWQSVLMVLGIALGVAVVVAVDLANASASRAFDLSVDAVTGRATHQIVAGPQGLDETLYVDLRQQGVTRTAAPVVTAYAASPALGDQSLQLLGIDPFAEAPFRSYLWGAGGAPIDALVDLLATPNAILLSASLAERYGLDAGARIPLTVEGRVVTATVAGLLQPADALSRRALDALILADIATAQELTGRLGRLDRVDLILPADEAEAQIARIEALLPISARVLPVDARTGAVEEMTAAFRVNLVALSLLALVVGMFLIYNTMTFSVMQRRALFGTLRCLGATRREVFALVLGEAFVVSLLGAGLGLLLGVLMGQAAVGMVAQTINDLYFTVTVRGVDVPPASLLKGLVLSIGATLAAAAVPAYEAATVPPRAALSRSDLETKARRTVAQLALGGLALLVVGTAVLLVPTRSLFISFGGTSVVVIGFALLTPLATERLMGLAARVMGRAVGALGRMAPRNVINALSRTAVAVAALMVAVAVTIGVSLMIGSFRHTVVLWLSHALQGDLYIAASDITATEGLVPVDPAVISLVEGLAGVAEVDLLRAVTVDSPRGPVYVEAGNSPVYGDQLLYMTADGSPAETWDAVQAGAVIVSEPFANRMDVPPTGGTVTLYTDVGARTFPIAGIYYDYATTQGTVIMSLRTYRELWEDDAVTAVVLKLTPQADIDAVEQEVRAALAPIQQVLVYPNQALRAEALVIFDRTFAITSALQILATAVAFIGVLSALLSLQLEKQRELGVLRAVGLTTRQLWGLVMMETGLMGAVAGCLAMPTGLALAVILVHIINRRAFGWTLLLQIVPEPFVQALLIATAASLLAGIYPAYRMSRMVAAEALRYE